LQWVRQVTGWALECSGGAGTAGFFTRAWSIKTWRIARAAIRKKW
jgi:hypothetical protein